MFVSFDISFVSFDISSISEVFSLIILIILFIEILQFIIGTGSLDIDDVILNTIGYFIGYFFTKYLLNNNS